MIRLNSASYQGLDAITVGVEVDVSRGIPIFLVIGKGDSVIKEAPTRIRTAIKKSDIEFPMGRIIVNLQPADKSKKGSNLDLAMAMGIIFDSNKKFFGLKETILSDVAFLGELSLSGDVLPVKGVSVMIERLKQNNIKYIVVPKDNLKEATLIEDVFFVGADNLKNLIEIFTQKNFKELFKKYDGRELYNKSVFSKEVCSKGKLDYGEIKGQEVGKRVITLVAAGGHNLLMVGPPGAGKTMLAERLITILPPLDYEEAVMLSKIKSVSGEILSDGLSAIRPIRRPHFSISRPSMIGGGINIKPGELSLAYGGVLILDEVNYFKKDVLMSIQKPIEEKEIIIQRKGCEYRFPFKSYLIMTCNPSWSLEDGNCELLDDRSYLSRLGQGILDRIELFLELAKVDKDSILMEGSTSKTLRDRVLIAQERQRFRFRNEDIVINADIHEKDIQRFCCIDGQTRKFLENAYEKLNLSMRGYSSVLKVSRTIADIEDRDNISLDDVMEALQYRIRR